ncbi:MAG: tyrosine--tRNA ligase [Planctomycetota bacterium]|nr:tyrosine--tRNA ligase [Planctomycetota bacterium]MDA1249389.1 tyrosine--tRNA ligase [Planctomycetota bacterium]
MPFPSVEEQLAIIRRGIEQICPEEELAAKLQKSRETDTPLRIKYGIDPTGIDVHLGHTVPLKKMQQFQELGHQAVIIIGNYTALVGDPSGRDEARSSRLSLEQIEVNAKDYLTQVGKVVDLNKAEVHRNGDWFASLSLADILNLCNRVTVAQMLNRDDFAKRFRDEKPIYLHECLYPVMQAQDSVEIKADIELGGTEQLFTFMLARDFQREVGLPQQIGVMSPILVGLDGKLRMGKSLGNYIGISEPPYEMMKKFMQLPDEVMRMYFELLTTIPFEEIDTLLSGHPKDAKMTLARSIINEYHDAGAGDEAASRWQDEIGGSALPSDIPVAAISRGDLDEDGCLPASKLFVTAGLNSSNAEARRLIAQGGGKLGEDKTKIESFDQKIKVEDGLLLWAGKKKYCRLELTE